VRHTRRHGHSGRAAVLLGGLVGFGLAAAIAWAMVGRGDGAAGPDLGASTGAAQTVRHKPVLHIVFPEGFTRRQMAERIAAVNTIAETKRGITPSLRPGLYLRATRHVTSEELPAGFKDAKPPDLEGFLFPATYPFTEDTTSGKLVGLQLEAFDRAWSQLDLRYARSKRLTSYDVLIIASMVEKEVQVPGERALVSAVIYNRLRKRMPLGIDATIRYGLGIPPTEPIHQSELDSDNPYNTRKFSGLPPTPIANPGLAAMQAAAHPAHVDYLYFVRKADCRSHFFTSSERKFNEYPRQGLQCG
jgi:UPF0755 protein